MDHLLLSQGVFHAGGDGGGKAEATGNTAESRERKDQGHAKAQTDLAPIAS